MRLLEQLSVLPIPQRPSLEKSMIVAEYRGMMPVCHFQTLRTFHLLEIMAQTGPINPSCRFVFCTVGNFLPRRRKGGSGGCWPGNYRGATGTQWRWCEARTDPRLAGVTELTAWTGITPSDIRKVDVHWLRLAWT